MEELHILLDTEEHTRIAEEGPSLHQILRSRKRQEARIIHCIHDSYGNPQTNSTDILCTFTESMQIKYDYIQVDEDCVQRMANTSKKTLPHAANTILDAPIAMEKLPLAVRNGKPHKAPEGDGNCQEFFKLTLETTKHDMLQVLNQMHSNGKIM